jgi:cation transport regulator ChaC
VPHFGDEVWGVLYRCTPEALDKMDCYEGVAAGHYRRSRVTVEVEDGQRTDAVTYVAGETFVCPEGRPSASYLERIVRGARDYGLPDTYVWRIERLGTGNSAAQSTLGRRRAEDNT